MTSPHSARPRQGYHESQPAKPSKPLEYIQQNRSMVDISSASSGTHRAHGPNPKTGTYGWYRTPAHSQPPPPIPPKVSGSTRSSDSSIAGVQKPYAQKVRGSEGNEFMAELEGDMVGLGLSSVNTEKKKGKRSPDAEAIAQAIINQSRAPPGKRKLRVLSLGKYFPRVPEPLGLILTSFRWGWYSWLFDFGYPLGHYASHTCSHKQKCSRGSTPASPPV